MAKWRYQDEWRSAKTVYYIYTMRTLTHTQLQGVEEILMIGNSRTKSLHYTTQTRLTHFLM